MNITELQHLLDTNGADLSRWPEDLRSAAERLIAADPAAAAACAQALRLDGLLVRHMAPVEGGHYDAAAEASASRVRAALASRPLPGQHRGWRWWPAELAAFDLAPAWPRVAALASVCVLGFALGLAGLGAGFGGFITRSTNADSDLSAIVFDPEPVIGLRP